MTISAIIHALERFASPSLQESWDNTGLQLGAVGHDCTGALVCLDCTPAAVDEAQRLGCNLIISHHPLFFKGIKRLTGQTPAAAAAAMAIRAGITVYSTHTAIDSAPGGVSYELARLLGIEPLRVLSPLEGRLVSLRVICPAASAVSVRDALFDAGAGAIGQYDCCSFTTAGAGTFRPLDGARPYDGVIGEHTAADEAEVQVVLPAARMAAVEAALREVHPYEEPAYAFTPMLNTLRTAGLGVYGILGQPLTPAGVVDAVKRALGIPAARCSGYVANADVAMRRVAVCGGAGGEFIPAAIAAGAQAYVTADIRYHDFQEYGDRILLIDAGHYETEAPIKNVISRVISRKFPNFAVHISAEQPPMLIV